MAVEYGGASPGHICDDAPEARGSTARCMEDRA